MNYNYGLNNGSYLWNQMQLNSYGTLPYLRGKIFSDLEGFNNAAGEAYDDWGTSPHYKVRLGMAHRVRNNIRTLREGNTNWYSFFDYVPSWWRRHMTVVLQKTHEHTHPNWRQYLEHSDYRASVTTGPEYKQLRQEMANVSRGNLSTFSDGSYLTYHARTWREEFKGSHFIRFTGEEARRLVAVCRLPSKCTVCGKVAYSCNCEWVDGSWVAPPPPISEGQSALRMEDCNINMQGKQGVAVGVELELHTVRRPSVEELARFCTDNSITRKPDGSTGVCIELCTSPMRQDVARNVLMGLHKRLRDSHANPSLGCGLHVHVDAVGLDRLDVQRLLKLWSRYGPRVWDAMPDVRHNSEYCRNTTHYVVGEVEYYGNYLSVKEIDGNARHDGDRYLDLNLSNLRNYRKTIEFRLFPAYSEDGGYDACDTQDDVPLLTQDQLLSCVEVARAFVISARLDETDQYTDLQTAINNLERSF